VDGHDSSEVWAGFRVARRASVVVNEIKQHDAAGADVIIDAQHDGYRRLPGRNLHRRRWSLGTGGLRIEDEISGTFASVEAFFHLHPEVQAVRSDANGVRLSRAGRELATVNFEGADNVGIEDGSWHPGFGESVPNVCIRVRFTRQGLISDLRWSGIS
jgi:uncharacterized heparinase superfamily protein